MPFAIANTVASVGFFVMWPVEVDRLEELEQELGVARAVALVARLEVAAALPVLEEHHACDVGVTGDRRKVGGEPARSASSESAVGPRATRHDRQANGRSAFVRSARARRGCRRSARSTCARLIPARATIASTVVCARKCDRSRSPRRGIEQLGALIGLTRGRRQRAVVLAAPACRAALGLLAGLRLATGRASRISAAVVAARTGLGHQRSYERIVGGLERAPV